MASTFATGHVISGVLIGAATAPALGVTPADPTYWAWTTVVAGCSILPDSDLKRTVADELFGPFTRGIRLGQTTLIPGLFTIVRLFLGGHRNRSHRIEGVLMFLAGVWACTHWLASSTIVLVLATGLGLRSIHLIAEWLFGIRYRKRYWLPLFAVSLAVGWLYYQTGAPLPGWVPFAMGLGCAVHICGDLVTDSGVRLTFATEKKSRLLPEPLCFKAGGWVENTIVVPPMFIAAVLVVCYQAGYDPVGSVLDAMKEM